MTYRNSNDLLFEKCKDMTKEQQLQFLKDQFSQLVRIETDRKQQQIFKNNIIEKTKKLNITKAID